MYHIGVDEAGRGPMIGPLVIAAIAIPKKDLEILKKYNITDSKKISPKKRLLAFDLIEKLSIERGWEIKISVCKPIEIDLAMETSNLNIFETEKFAETINNLEFNKKEGGKLILDACDVNEERFGMRVTNLIEKWPWNSWDLVSIHRADSIHRIVGAASIIAKVTRDKIIKKIERELGIPIGSGYPSDPKSKQALFELCKHETPNEFLRWNWASIRNHWNRTNGCDPPKRDYRNLTSKNITQRRLSEY